MEETVLTINGENIATILLIGVVGYAVLRIATLWYSNRAAG